MVSYHRPMWPVVLVGLVGLVRIDASTPCPTAADVGAELAALLPPSTAPRDQARIDAEPGGLRVQLRDAGGALLASRRLTAGASCRELAQAVAVIIGAWEAELRPSAAPTLRLGPPSARSRATYDVAGALLGSLAGGQVTAGGALEASVAPRGFRVGGRLALFAAAPRDQTLGPGRASFSRIALAVGPRLRLAPTRLLIDLHLEALGALLVVSGTGFASTSRDEDFDPGLGGGVRVGLRAGPVAPFVEVGVVGWLRKQQLRATNVSPTTTLPQVEGLLSVGVAAGRFL